ncbi:chemotaxis protein CheA [Thermicanus aegyptius]|uniref:chemotaxis protein CheA n=1 Tax=Thermicanus aegyptius TaxID=94009 RepID=UPI0003F51DBF|nr:chemotaxis protein CheA [Thermicanus aegyptius]
MESSSLPELTGLFLDEVEEQLQIMEQEILKLEQYGESEETIQSLFRAAHTLKGSSATMGFDEMKRLTHELEHVLDRLRNRHLRATKSLINLLFKGLDQLRVLKAEFAEGVGTYTEIGPLLEELQHAADGEADPVEGRNEVPEAFLFTGDPAIVSKVQDALESGLKVYEIEVHLSPDCPMKSARGLVIHNQLDAWGDLLEAAPTLEELRREESFSFTALRFLLATDADPSRLKEALLSLMDITDVTVSNYHPLKQSHRFERMSIPSDEPEKRTISPTIAERGRGAQTIRVDVERLENLMNLVGELVIDQTRISQVERVLHHRYLSDENVDELRHITDHLIRVIVELQDSVMKVRMLPIEQLFTRFPRMVRDLAQSLKKEVDLVIEGGETELDRTVIEEITDPLIHLIRNAVDHGIEPAEERKRLGKTTKGRLRIRAAHEENQVVITVEDDGAGIDPVKMKESARLKGIITEEELKRLSDQEAVYLIFRPGFSTASSVSDISGRGVGMDIVRNHIEKLNGVIDIESKPGEGTRFKIKLPLTLAIITGLLIKLSGRTFILPMSSVVEIVRMPPEAVQTIKGDTVVVIRDRVLPVIWLHDYFHLPRVPQKKNHHPIVVVGIAEKRFALMVDELMGNQEVVVKSLGTYIGKVVGISGATILGDGRVALILETAGIDQLIRRKW